MSEQTQNDIRRLLKTFGVRADQEISRYLEQNPSVQSIQVHILLEGQPDSSPAHQPLHFEVEGDIRR